MKRFKAWLSALIAAALTLGAVATPSGAEAALSARQPREEALPIAYADDAGNVYLIDGDCADGAILDMDAAARLVDTAAEMFGGGEDTHFEPWREVGDTVGNRYYIFRQMYADTTVSGGAVKVVTDAQGTVLGLTASVETELPDVEASAGITAEEAEAAVAAHAREEGQPEVKPLSGRTEKTILPVNLELDPYSEEEKEERRYVWVVYTLNAAANGSELPYLAHYVAMDGEYLYSMPAFAPGDEASAAGYDAAYLFSFMEPADYTGTVTLSDGTQKEITVTLMRDRRTGMYYLGNIERRIAVADCYPFLYEGGSVALQASADNTGWDDTCLLSLYNYCRAWDYYSQIGWEGGDGLRTPMLILKDYCDEDHVPVDNAAYAGCYYGWEVFLSSSANDLAQCLDVLAHEFTHCVTEAVMTFNAYSNDYGAINEALSDIQGNLCQMMLGDTDDTQWLIGETGSMIVRSMSDPHRYGQPEFAWDLYYQEKVGMPTDLNDRGGVHSNSSLLNHTAYRLCVDGGMSLEEARAFWFAAACSMVPGTDYAQLCDLLPWVLDNLGMQAYRPALSEALDAVGMGSNALPEAIPENRTLVTLTLPDDPKFTDGNWGLVIFSVDMDALDRQVNSILSREEGYENALNELAEILGMPEETLWGVFEGDLDPLMDMLEAPEADAQTPEDIAEAEDAMGALLEWARMYFDEVIYYGMGAAGEDDRTIHMVCRPGMTLPVLVRLEMGPGSMTPVTAGVAAYTMGRWVDLGSTLESLLAMAEEAPYGEETYPWEIVPDEDEAEEDDDSNRLPFLDFLFGDGDSTESAPSAPGLPFFGFPNPDDSDEDPFGALAELSGLLLGGGLMLMRGMIFTTLYGGETCVIPDDGLADVTILPGELFADLFVPVVPEADEAALPEDDAAAALPGEPGTFEGWNDNAYAPVMLTAIVEGDAFEIEPSAQECVAFFDLDGACYDAPGPVVLERRMFAERVLRDDAYAADAQMIAAARKVDALSDAELADMPETAARKLAEMSARAFAGMTVEEYQDYARRYLQRVGDGIHVCAPVMEAAEYLWLNGYEVWFCSDADRFFCRVLLESAPYAAGSPVSGANVRLSVRPQDGAAVRTAEALIEDKTARAVREAGGTPLIVFGGPGSEALAQYATAAGCMVLMLAPDGCTEAQIDEWRGNGWLIVEPGKDFADD